MVRHSPLGWVVFGASPRGHALVHHVLNVKISVPIGMIDFWSTESMGLAVKPFNCQTKKLSLIEQRKQILFKIPAKRLKTMANSVSLEKGPFRPTRQQIPSTEKTGSH